MRVGICLFSLFLRSVICGRVFVSLHFQMVDLASLRRVLSIIYVGSFDLPYILSLTVKVALGYGSAQSRTDVQYLSACIQSE